MFMGKVEVKTYLGDRFFSGQDQKLGKVHLDIDLKPPTFIIQIEKNAQGGSNEI